MAAATTTTSSSHWKDLVRVSGSFYCNLSSTSEEIECTPAEDNNRTVLKVPGADSPHLDRDSNTIKLVIGGSTSTPSEPLSLDTSEYVSWDGGSILAGHQTPEGEEEGEEDVSSTPAATTPRIVGLEDELTHTCRQYFDHRQHKLLLLQRSESKGVVTAKGDDGRVPPPIRPSSATPKQPGLQDKMEHLRREIVSLVNQDDALFRQLLALNTSIHQLRSQSLQRRVRTLSGGRSRSNGTNQLSPSPSAASLTSLTSMSDEEDEEDEVRVSPTEVMMSTAAPLTRQRVSYPPKARSSQGASSSGLSRNSFNSSSSSTSSNNSSSSYSPTWSVSSAGSSGSSSISAAVNKNVSILNTNSKTPRSPHSSFYCRTGRSTSSGSASLQHHQRNSHHGDYRSISNGDLLMVIHKRQGSYDSGIQGSEPSDAEVFV